MKRPLLRICAIGVLVCFSSPPSEASILGRICRKLLRPWSKKSPPPLAVPQRPLTDDELLFGYFGQNAYVASMLILPLMIPHDRGRDRRFSELALHAKQRAKQLKVLLDDWENFLPLLKEYGRAKSSVDAAAWTAAQLGVLERHTNTLLTENRLDSAAAPPETTSDDWQALRKYWEREEKSYQTILSYTRRIRQLIDLILLREVTRDFSPSATAAFETYAIRYFETVAQHYQTPIAPEGEPLYLNAPTYMQTMIAISRPYSRSLLPTELLAYLRKVAHSAYRLQGTRRDDAVTLTRFFADALDRRVEMAETLDLLSGRLVLESGLPEALWALQTQAHATVRGLDDPGAK